MERQSDADLKHELSIHSTQPIVRLSFFLTIFPEAPQASDRAFLPVSSCKRFTPPIPLPRKPGYIVTSLYAV